MKYIIFILISISTFTLGGTSFAEEISDRVVEYGVGVDPYDEDTYDEDTYDPREDVGVDPYNEDTYNPSEDVGVDPYDEDTYDPSAGIETDTFY